MMRMARTRNQSAGFTIVELMIATAVFGTVLLLITTAILQITRVYYKGITESRTQDTSRTIIDLVSQGIQFSGGDVTTTIASPTAGSSYAFCVGGKQYSYTLGYQLSDNPTATQTYHALVVDDLAGCTAGSTAQNVRAATVSGRELVAPNMRLANLQVASAGSNLYRVTVRVVYGDNDLLNNPNDQNASCRQAIAGRQFCAVSELSTIVTKRVQ